MCKSSVGSNREDAIRILIAENIPSLNKGEETILGGMLESFKAIGPTKVSMFSYQPEIDGPRYDSIVEVVDIREFALFKYGLTGSQILKAIISFVILAQHFLFMILYVAGGPRVLRITKAAPWKHYEQADIVIIGHDAAFAIGGGVGIPIMFYPVFAPFFFKALGKYVALYGGDISLPRRFKWLVGNVLRIALDRMDLITLRNRTSYRNLKALKVKNPNVHITADLAFLLEPSSSELTASIMKQEDLQKGGKPLIGMTVTREIASTAFFSVDEQLTSYTKHVQEIAKVVDFLTDSWRATVVFVPHCIGVGLELDDRIPAQDIFAACQNKTRVKVITREYDAAALKGLLGQFDLFVGERLHSVINAMSMNVPSIFLTHATDQRADILKMADQESAICDVANLQATELIQKMTDVWSQRENIRNELDHQMAAMRTSAQRNGQLLCDLLKVREFKA